MNFVEVHEFLTKTSLPAGRSRHVLSVRLPLSVALSVTFLSTQLQKRQTITRERSHQNAEDPVAMKSLRQVSGDLQTRWTYPVYHRRLRLLAGIVLPFLYQGSGVICPCCEGSFRRFIQRFKKDELCPRCLSLKRHRLLWLYLRDKTELGSKDICLLHFAPEESIAGRLRALPRLKYITADLNLSSGAMACTDITRPAIRRRKV